MKNTAISVLVATHLLAGSLAALAQEEHPAPAPRRGTQENLITFKLLRMTQVLELTEEQTAKIYPAVTRLEKEKHGIVQKLTVRMRSLRDLLKAEKPDESKLLSAVEEIERLRLEVRQKDEELAQFLKSNLTATQYAKYTLFLVDFYRGLNETLDRARMMRNQYMRKRGTEEPPPDNLYDF